MLFRVTARIGFVNGSCTEVPFNLRTEDEKDLKKLVTPEYVMTNVSDDWGAPIANVSVVKFEAILER